MFLFEPDRTQFDLSWRMFGIHVRVHPLFWLMACLLGAPYLERLGPVFLLIWVACVFVSILVHEMGHVVMGRIFGREGHIVLYSFGGLAFGSSDLPNRWKRIAVSFAGPLAGFLLYGVVYLIQFYLFPLVESRGARIYFGVALVMLLWINLAWGILNLLPIYPLDGGKISWELFSAGSHNNGPRLALGLSFLLSALIAINCILEANGRPLLPWLPMGGMWTAILFGMLAVENFMMLQQLSSRQQRPWDEEW